MWLMLEMFVYNYRTNDTSGHKKVKHNPKAIIGLTSENNLIEVNKQFIFKEFLQIIFINNTYRLK